MWFDSRDTSPPAHSVFALAGRGTADPAGALGEGCALPSDTRPRWIHRRAHRSHA